MHDALARALAREILRERMTQARQAGGGQHWDRGPLRRALGRAGRKTRDKDEKEGDV